MLLYTVLYERSRAVRVERQSRVSSSSSSAAAASASISSLHRHRRHLVLLCATQRILQSFSCGLMQLESARRACWAFKRTPALVECAGESSANMSTTRYRKFNYRSLINVGDSDNKSIKAIMGNLQTSLHALRCVAHFVARRTRARCS